MILGIVASSRKKGLDYSVLNITRTNNDLDTTGDVAGVSIGLRNFGGKTFVLGTTGYTIYEYSEWTTDLSTITYQSKSFALGTTTQDFAFNADGTNIYYIANGALIRNRTLSTAYDVSTCGSINNAVTFPGGHIVESRAMTIKPDGTELYVSCNSTDSIVQYSVSPAHDVSNAANLTYVGEIGTATDGCDNPRSLAISQDGKYLVTGDPSDDLLYQYILSTPFDITSATFDDTIAIVAGAHQGIAYNNDGTLLAVAENSVDVYEYDLNN